MKYLLITAILAASASTAVNAQTCAAPLPLESDTVTAGDTCGGTVGLDLGGTVYGHPSVVYSFTWQPTDGGNEPDQILNIASPYEVAIVTDCNSAPITAGANGVPINLDASGLTAGATYLAIVTTDPGLPVTDPPTCGAFSIETDTLPVEIQSFSID